MTLSHGGQHAFGIPMILTPWPDYPIKWGDYTNTMPLWPYHMGSRTPPAYLCQKTLRPTGKRSRIAGRSTSRCHISYYYAVVSHTNGVKYWECCQNWKSCANSRGHRSRIGRRSTSISQHPQQKPQPETTPCVLLQTRTGSESLPTIPWRTLFQASTAWLDLGRAPYSRFSMGLNILT